MADLSSLAVVRLELHGERAEEGIELDSLERFIEKFRGALRDFDRSVTDRGGEVRRGGHPDARDRAASSFRLVGYGVGSAVLDLAEPIRKDEANTLAIETDGPAMRNLRALLDGVEHDKLESAIIDQLDEARRALGEQGTFAVQVPRRPSCAVDATVVKRLRAAPKPLATAELLTVYGTLHLIASEKYRVEIRATDGYNWQCTYEPSLEDKVLPLIKHSVWARGVGTRERANKGTLRLEDLGPLPKYETTSLFTGEPIPIDKLAEQQGIVAPQRLANLALPDASTDDVDRFLAVMLE
jgi:hypothetical protein